MTLHADCLQYEEFEGGPCNCWPTGWDGITGAEEICDLTGFTSGGGCNTNITDVSPSGGNFVGLHVFPAITEGISRTWTGLTPGSEYTFVMWWNSVEWECAGTIITCCADLWVVVDGVDYIFPAVNDWTLLELCIEALTDEIYIEVKGIANGGFSGYILLDDAHCSIAQLDCCELVVDLTEDTAVCPNEDLFLEGEFMGETGSANIEWVSDPSDGINYLDDPTVLDPTFNFSTTNDNFPGQIYTFTMIVEDDICLFGKDIEIEVLPYPNFNFSFETSPICSDLEEYEFPLVSEEGVSGTWDTPIFFPVDNPGAELQFVFTPDPGEVTCPISTEHTIAIQEFIGPSFDFPLEYCRVPGGIVELPDVSLEGIEGTWNILLVEMDLLPDGYVDLIFTPDELFCTSDVDWGIEIYSGDEPSFTLPTELCLQDNILVFPETSDEGIEGTWSIYEIDPTDYSGFVTNTFTPNASNDDCYTTYEHTVEILDVLSPEFNFPLNLCSTDDPITLNGISIEGHEGQWSLPIIDPANSPSTINVLWTPNAGQSPCVVETEIIIQVQQAIIPAFNLPAQLCNSEDQFVFPNGSTNSIMGTWSIPSLDPSMLSGTVVSIFLPESVYCAETIEAEIEIITSITPSFSIQENICASDDMLSLPNMSNNGIAGTWDIPNIDPANYPGQVVEFLFTPNDPNLCAEEYALSITVEAETEPVFTLPTTLCWQEEDFIFQDTSLNNITGTWVFDEIDIDNNLGTNFTNTFTPVIDFCASSIEITIDVTGPYNVNLESTNPTSCTDENGSVQLQGDLMNKQFSIDGGITWQTDPEFNDLAGGFYQVMVASITEQDCILSLDVSLVTPNAPNITMMSTEPISSCNSQDGSIIVDAFGTDLEYSIDGGDNWQSDPVFTNLSGGTYDILVRTFNSLDCIISAFAIIDDFPETEISNFQFSDVTDCGLTDGSLLIEATGLDLEYSIDNGMSWSNSGVFENLTSGLYEIIVQSSIASECNESFTQILSAPGMPTIDNSIIVSPSLCFLSSGQIEIIATGNNLEYSIDDGNTWQGSPIFEDLIAGSYILVVRDANQLNCYDTRQVILENEQDMLDALNSIDIPPSACGAEDASIEIIGNVVGLEFSIDGGVTWQENPLFDFIAANPYNIFIRKVDAIDCTTSLLIIIEEPDCPCEDLSIDYLIVIPDCAEDGNASIELTSINGVMGSEYTITWENGQAGTFTEVDDDGTYMVTITYDLDCEWVETFEVNLKSPIEFELAAFDPDCENALNGEILISNIEGGSGNLEYSLDGISFQDEPGFESLPEGIYEIYVRDQLGCVSTETITLIAAEIPQVLLQENHLINLGDTLLLEPIIELDLLDDYQWSSEDSNFTLDGVNAIVAPLETTNYIFSYQVDSCTIDLRVVVEVIKNTNIFIPTVFSPDGDGNNDLFYVQSENELAIESMRIFDRWGNLMFENNDIISNNEAEGWNGRFKGQRLTPGVYVYVIDYETDEGLQIESGTVTIVY